MVVQDGWITIGVINTITHRQLLKEWMSFINQLNMQHSRYIRLLSMDNAELEATQNLQFLLLSLLPSHLQHQVLQSCLLQSPFKKHWQQHLDWLMINSRKSGKAAAMHQETIWPQMLDWAYNRHVSSSIYILNPGYHFLPSFTSSFSFQRQHHTLIGNNNSRHSTSILLNGILTLDICHKLLRTFLLVHNMLDLHCHDSIHILLECL